MKDKTLQVHLLLVKQKNVSLISYMSNQRLSEGKNYYYFITIICPLSPLLQQIEISFIRL